MLISALADVPSWILQVGGLIGSGIAAYTAVKAKNSSKRAEEKSDAVNREVIGPDDVPTIRQVLNNHNKEVRDQFTTLSDGIEGLGNRIVGLERAVFTQIESRLGEVERSTRDLRAISSALSSATELLSTLNRKVIRLEVNMHTVAGICHAKLASEEEAMAIREKENSNR